MKTTLTLLLAAPLYTQAAVLTGTGTHLPLAPIPQNTGYNHEHPMITTVTGGYTATWSSAVQSDWQGTFTGTGNYTGSGSSSSTTMDFTSLPTGLLPEGSFFTLGDLDSSSDTVTLRAIDASGNLMSEWLNDTAAVYGMGNGPGGTVILTDLPGWTWNAGDSSYFFDGGTQTGGNPVVGVYLENNQAIAALEVLKPSTSYSFSVRAPLSVPEPSSVLLVALGTVGAVMRRRRS